jgi:uncharacterized protein
MEVTNNKNEFRFETPVGGGELAVLQYRWLRGSLVLMHTLVPVAARGKGTGATLVKYVLDYAREQHLKVVIYCPFVERYIKEHPEYNDLIDETHRK